MPKNVSFVSWRVIKTTTRHNDTHTLFQQTKTHKKTKKVYSKQFYIVNA